MHPNEYAEMRRRSAPDLDDEALLNSAQVKALFSGVSDMAIWRWTRDPRVQFPEPDVRINGRKYWKRGTIRRAQDRLADRQAA